MLSSRVDTNLRRTMRRFLTHTYTWIDNDQIPVLDEEGNPTYDLYDNQIFEDASPVIDKPCLFLYEDISNNDPGGPIVTKVPTLYVLASDEVAEKDTIVNIMDRSGTLLIEGASVELVDPTAEMNSSVLRVLRLSGAVTV